MLLSIISALFGLVLTEACLKLMTDLHFSSAVIQMSEVSLITFTHLLFAMGFIMQYQSKHLLQLSNFEYQAHQKYGMKASAGFLVLSLTLFELLKML
ncbi:hypothetical protein [Ferrimonas aestuarii]|uniref:Uncharacterized protein n=1 Tax=Ferrimonas aestuarii TaxID=2569539 RepID=A0A4U1BS26_9GAMM|nr:hypothetical protein [Ferrimonas aestuarii]TKB54706.1 hypothetical protein FCL42_11170 [Ferrimonas aestuarii]